MKLPFFNSKAAKVHFFANLSIFILLCVIVVVDIMVRDNALPENPITYTVDKPLKVMSRFDRDTIYTKVKKGDTLQILGYDEASWASPTTFWVQTHDGTRGTIPCYEMGIPMGIWNKDTKQYDEVEILGVDHNKHKYYYRLGDGEKKELKFDKITPLFADSMKVKHLESTIECYMSREKFEREYLGSTYAENEKKHNPALFVAKQKDSLLVAYPLSVINLENGKRYKPIVAYSEDKAESVKYDYYNDRSDWLIKIWPGLGAIMDNDIASFLIKGSMFEMTPRLGENASTLKVIGIYALAIVMLIFVLLWLFVTPMIPVFLIGFLMHVRPIFYPLSNKVLGTIIAIIAVISTYIWATMMLAWGMMMLFLLVYIFVVLFSIGFAGAFLGTKVPHGRCPGCRTIDSITFKESRFLRNYDKWMRESEYVKMTGQRTQTWQTWTQRTTTYGDGRKTTERINVRDHKRVTSTHLYDDYKVLYNVDVYEYTYTCPGCGHIEHSYPEKYTEIKREYLGSHTETTTTES